MRSFFARSDLAAGAAVVGLASWSAPTSAQSDAIGAVSSVPLQIRMDLEAMGRLRGTAGG